MSSAGPDNPPGSPDTGARSTPGRAKARARSGGSRLLEATLESVDDGVVVVDREGTFVFFNAAAERILGRGALDTTPSAWSSSYGCYRCDRVTPYPSDELPLARALRGECAQDEFFVRNSGIPEGAWISVRGIPLIDGAGAPAGAAVVFHDVTERWRADQTVRRLSQAVERTTDSVVITDAQANVEYVNPAFEAITGFTKEQALGCPVAALETGAEQLHAANGWGHPISEEGWSGSFLHRKSTGELFSVEQSVTPVRDKAGRLTHFVSVMRDVTGEQKSLAREADMRLARLVQQRLFPDRAPTMRGFDLAGAAFPADTACGDYYDFIPISHRRLAIVIGDVAGHGFGPALLMAETRAYLRSLLRSTTDLVRIMSRLNGFLCQDTQPQHFVTLMLVILDPRHRNITYSSAGHVPGYLLDGFGATRSILESTSLPLGIFPDTAFAVSPEIPLEDGDLFLLLTDGATEAQNAEGDCLEPGDLIQVVAKLREQPSRRIVAGLHEAIESFVPPPPCPRPDDITAIVCKAEPRGPVNERHSQNGESEGDLRCPSTA